jgi:hypothetical protein
MPHYAIPFGSDETDGDSSWNVGQCVECELDNKFEELVQKVRDQAHSGDKDVCFSGFEDEEIDKIVGFWIVSETTKKMFDNCDPGELGNDSAVYRHNSSMKSMAQAGAVKTVIMPRPVAPEGYSLWVKKLGQCHLNKRGESSTVCGAAMLGNNYPQHPYMEKCPKCWGLGEERI